MYSLICLCFLTILVTFLFHVVGWFINWLIVFRLVFIYFERILKGKEEVSASSNISSSLNWLSRVYPVFWLVDLVFNLNEKISICYECNILIDTGTGTEVQSTGGCSQLTTRRCWIKTKCDAYKTQEEIVCVL